MLLTGGITANSYLFNRESGVLPCYTYMENALDRAQLNNKMERANGNIHGRITRVYTGTYFSDH